MLNDLLSVEAMPYQAKTAPRYYMLGHDLKCHAWCPELGRMVTASEVWHLLFGESVYNTEFNFYCVDVGCRARLILRNCYPYMTDIDAHFRLYPRAAHHHECSYIAEQSLKKKQLLSRRRQEAIQMRGKRPQGWCV